MFTLACAAYNLVRMRNLMAAAVPSRKSWPQCLCLVPGTPPKAFEARQNGANATRKITNNADAERNCALDSIFQQPARVRKLTCSPATQPQIERSQWKYGSSPIPSTQQHHCWQDAKRCKIHTHL
jgi:hypothetical protein